MRAVQQPKRKSIETYASILSSWFFSPQTLPAVAGLHPLIWYSSILPANHWLQEAFDIDFKETMQSCDRAWHHFGVMVLQI